MSYTLKKCFDIKEYIMSLTETIPYPSIRRFPSYLQVIRHFRREGSETVSSADIARELNLTNIQVRKDIGFTGIIGKPKIGYDIAELEDVIVTYLGWHTTHDAFLVGVGGLGSALLGYPGFQEYGLNILAGFDVKSCMIGKRVHSKPVYHIDDLKKYVEQKEVRIGILTVPQPVAQLCAEKMVEAGIKAIWNFSTEQLDVPDDIIVQRENLSVGLALLSVKVSQPFADRDEQKKKA
jgi:redox-sensing transcriptional repressor